MEQPLLYDETTSQPDISHDSKHHQQHHHNHANNSIDPLPPPIPLPLPTLTPKVIPNPNLHLCSTEAAGNNQPFHMSSSSSSSSFSPPRLLHSLSYASDNDKQPITITTVAFYSFGHVLNDCCASCWFTYLLIMLRSRGLTGTSSATVFLCGQVADGVSTVLSGLLSDRASGFYLTNSCALGRRQSVYLIASVFVAFSFALVFAVILPSSTSSSFLLLYYCISASLFNINWAAVQVTHMSLVPELTHVESERIWLNSARYSESVASNLFIFLSLAFLTAISTSMSSTTDMSTATMDDQEMSQQFSYLAIIALCVGSVATVAFLIGVREPMTKPLKHNVSPASSSIHLLNDEVSTQASATVIDGSMEAETLSALARSLSIEQLQAALVNRSQEGYKEWLKVANFWKVMSQYALTRLCVNCAQTFLVFYLLDTIQLNNYSITFVPLVVFISSFCSSLSTKSFSHSINKVTLSLAGSVCTIIALIIFWLLTSSSFWLFVYMAAMLLGFGFGLIMVISQQLPADLLGKRTEHSAFVYGAFSFADKIINGVVIAILQSYNVVSVEIDDRNTSDGEYIRFSLVVVPVIACFVAAFVLLTLDLKNINSSATAALDHFSNEQLEAAISAQNASTT